MTEICSSDKREGGRENEGKREKEREGKRVNRRVEGKERVDGPDEWR